MALNYKRLALVLLFLVITIGIGITIYYVFFRNVFGPGGNENTNGVVTLPNANENRNVTGNVNVGGQLPNANASTLPPRPVAQGGETEVLPVTTTIPGGTALAPNGQDLLTYDPTTGQFFEISPDGRTRTPLTDDRYPAADRVTWSPLRDKAILEFPDDSKFLYDFRSKRQYTLAPEMEDISFSPSADRISFKFIGEDPEDRLLVISNFDGTGSRTIEPLANKASQFDVDWSAAGNIVATFHESIDANRQRVIPLGQLGENFSSFNVPGRGYQGDYSPSGEFLLYSVFTKESAYNPELYVADGRAESFGQRNVKLDLQTWPDKCTFGSGTTIYCAVPKYLEQGTALYPELASGIPDDIYRIDLTTGLKQLVAIPVDSSGRSVYTISQMYLSADESILYFHDQRTNQVSKIQLR